MDRLPDDAAELLRDKAALHLRTVEQFLEEARRLHSFGLRTIELVLSSNDMDYRVGHSPELGFVRVIGRAYSSGVFCSGSDFMGRTSEK